MVISKEKINIKYAKKENSSRIAYKKDKKMTKDIEHQEHNELLQISTIFR